MQTTYEIHPAIGIARVGVSEAFFIGPEPDGIVPTRYRDPSGRLLRQGARFRVMACERDDEGALLGATELTPESATITWTVHLANRKAEAERFPSDPDVPPDQRPRRNPRHANRDELVIDPGSRVVDGPDRGASFDTGRFKGMVVPLGEIRTEPSGRLIALGGFGRSEPVTSDGRPSPLNDFANNSDWFDDVSDGPVRALVTFHDDGRREEAKPAWVIVAPPDFAPGIQNLVTLYDVAREAAVARGWVTIPEAPSFTWDVYPVLSRAVGYWWVSRIAGQGHGPGRGGSFSTLWTTLADPEAPSSVRQRILERLRDPGESAPSSTRFTMPRLHDETNSGEVLALTATQYAILERWVAGQFVGDWSTAQPDPDPLVALSRAPLESCSGGPFFPGIEAGAIMTEPALYSEPYRLDADSLEPGALTAGNALPWQADIYACRFDSQKGLGWWPAQRPDQVFPDLASIGALRSEDWDRGVSMFEGMVENWDQLGVVVEQSGPDGKPAFVETERLLAG